MGLRQRFHVSEFAESIWPGNSLSADCDAPLVYIDPG